MSSCIVCKLSDFNRIYFYIKFYYICVCVYGFARSRVVSFEIHTLYEEIYMKYAPLFALSQLKKIKKKTKQKYIVFSGATSV